MRASRSRSSPVRQSRGWRRCSERWSTRLVKNRAADASSEIGELRYRNLSVVAVPVFVGVFGTHMLRPQPKRAPIRHGRRPRRREHTLIFDGDFDLQMLSFIVGIEIYRI